MAANMAANIPEKGPPLISAEHIEHNAQIKALEAAHARTTISKDIPLAEVLENHLDEDPKRLHRVRRKVDIRLTVTLAVLYTFAFIDRGNLGNANIAGMNKDLELSVSNRYSIVTMIFFVGYIIVDIPSTMIMKKLGASIMIPSVCLAFGIITIGQGFLKSWGSLAACRVLLGLFEGALLPGSLFLLQVWYTRFEFHKRMAGYYLVGIASSGLSGLLAWGIAKMDGTSGIAGWRWIFILEGIVSCVVAICAYWTLIDLPEDATKPNAFGMPAFLSKEEAAIIIAHVERDREDAQTERFGFKEMLYHTRDWQVWEFAMYVLLNNVALYAFSFFLPKILKGGFGYPTGKANLYTFPPYACALVWMMAVAWFCDKFKTRGPVMLFNSVLYIIGLSMVGFLENVNARYAGVFLGVIGICANVPTQFAYQHANTVGQAKRALCVALMTSGGACGGIISGNIFQAKDAPNYTPALIICICFQCITILSVTKNFFYYTYMNRKADRGELIIGGVPHFRYTL